MTSPKRNGREKSLTNGSSTLNFRGTGVSMGESSKFTTKGSDRKIVQKTDANGNNVIIISDEKDNFEINTTKIQKSLKELRKHEKVPIKDLPQEILTEFNHVNNVISILHKTPAYGILYNMILTEFNGVVPQSVGTVGAYFVGCTTSTNFKGTPACAAVCAGNLAPNSEKWATCDKLSISYDCDTGKFSTMNLHEDKREAYIFAPIDKFKGFTKQELQSLKDFGVERIKIVRYSSASNYSEETSEFVEISKMKSTQQTVGSSSGSTAAAWGVFFVILIIIFLLLLWVAYSNRQ